jgi:hypothetical protein
MVKDSILSIRDSIFVKVQSSIQLSISMGLACPTASQWPNCALPSQEFSDRAHSLATLSHIKEFLFLPLVRPEARQSFEAFAADHYLTDGGYPNGTGVSAFGSGIFAITPDREKYRAPNHTAHSAYNLTVPIFEITDLRNTSHMLLYDTHSDPAMGKAIDAIIDCAARVTLEEEITGEDKSRFFRHSHCAAMVDSIPSLDSKYTASIGVPIFPSQNQTELVGFISSLFAWHSVLSSTIRTDSTFLCKIESSTSSLDLLFEVDHGVVVDRTGEDIAEKKQIGRDARMRKSFLLAESIFAGETSYTITYYSTGDAPTHSLALIICMCCIGVSVFISVSFEIFNSLIKQETVEVSQLLDSKRVFVRFVSHEIRCATCPHLSLTSSLPPSLS